MAPIASPTARARVRAGIGGYHPGLRGISRSYLEAQQAIEAGRKLRPEAVVHRHDELIPHLVLTQNPRLAERFVAHNLGRLMDAKVRNRGQLLETLEAYLVRGSVKDAAAALGLHRHTVLYRLDKAADTLTLCWDAKGGKAVPEDFAAKKGSGLMLLVLKHELRAPPTR